MRTTVVVGGGYAGFCTAWKLEKKLRRDEARIAVIDPRPYMKTKPYAHHSLGVVASLGLGRGIFQYRGIVSKGFPAWLMHRGYHVLAVPSWERKVRVFAIWLTAAMFGRDIVSLASVQDPRRAFVAGGELFGLSAEPPGDHARST